ncbi:unnamed protein product [Chrysodeixis includens]|uniref:Uncharacterized protein n=1 Tax=Chrysodeixis includens TaxID=689277 RepID=A0A9N8PZI7_CHRIL|nr:unnamed protein product [Chrysodeixis includens]
MGSTGLTLADLPNIFIMIGALVALFVMLVILLRQRDIRRESALAFARTSEHYNISCASDCFRTMDSDSAKPSGDGLRNMEVIGIMGEGREDAWGRAMQPPRLLMQRVHIPFTFKIQENAPIGYNAFAIKRLHRQSRDYGTRHTYRLTTSRKRMRTFWTECQSLSLSPRDGRPGQ